MKLLVYIFSLLLISSTAMAQKQINDPNAEVRTVNGSYTAISVSGGIDLYLSGGPEAVVVSASKPEYRDLIRTEVTDGVLKIRYEVKNLKTMLRGGSNVRAYVSYTTLKSLTASGGSDVIVDGSINGDRLALTMSGGSDFKGAVKLNELIVNQSGGSDVKISGTSTTVKVIANGGSDFDGSNLSAEVCNLSASGASDITVTATGEISARASGASDIKYKGNPQIKVSDASGASSIKRKS